MFACVDCANPHTLRSGDKMKLNKVPLKNVCDISMGQSPAGEFYNENNEGYPMIAGAGDFCELYPLAKKYTTEANKLSKIDDIILCIRATIGDINWSDKIYCLGRGVAGLTPKKEKLDSHYLWHFLISDKNTLFSKATGSTFKQVSKNHIEEWEIPLPDLPTQTQIAKILDKSTALIAKRKAQIAELDVLVQSVFLEMFGDPIKNPKGWETKSLSEICDVSSSKRIFEKEYVSDGIPFYRTKEIVELSKGKRISTELFISKERYEELKEKFTIPEKGHLLISAVGTIGAIWIVDDKQPFYFKDGNLLWVKPICELSSIYLKLSLEFFIEKYKLSMPKGTAYSALTIEKLKSVRVLFPELNLQTQFAQIVEKIQTQKSQLQQSLAELEMQHQALMQRAFRGELV